MVTKLILKLDLFVIKMYHHAKNELSVATFKSYSLCRQTDTQTDSTKTLPYPYMWAVISNASVGTKRTSH